MENVPQFLKSGQFRSLRDATSPRGALSGWVIEVAELNAADFGVPQSRRRAVVIGRRRGTRPVGFPEPFGTSRSVREAWADVDIRVTNADLPRDSFVDYLGVTVPGTFKMREIHVTRRPTAVSQARFAAIPPGGNRFDLPDELKAPCWRRHTTGSGDVMGRLYWDRPSVTIRTEFQKPEKGRYLHPQENRPITPYEAALLQGFPDHFLWCGTKTSIAKQIGNAVPPPLAAAVARRIADRL
jgi:DNA (cytosine-5)-methyltransferase 1